MVSPQARATAAPDQTSGVTTSDLFGLAPIVPDRTGDRLEVVIRAEALPSSTAPATLELPLSGGTGQVLALDDRDRLRLPLPAGTEPLARGLRASRNGTGFPIDDLVRRPLRTGHPIERRASVRRRRWNRPQVTSTAIATVVDEHAIGGDEGP